jgi:hypothetical protein
MNAQAMNMDNVGTGLAKKEIDEISLGGESWMDQSIQIYIDTRKSPDEDDDSKHADITILPPPSSDKNNDGAYKNVYAELIKPVSPPKIKPSAPIFPPPLNPEAKVIPESPTSTAVQVNSRDSFQNQLKHSEQTNINMSNEIKTMKKYDLQSKSISRFIIPRTSLPYKIDHSDITMEWTITMHTNQEALDRNDQLKIEESILKASFKTEHEARAACEQYAPPRMHSFDDYSKCHICKKSFNKVIRRPCHCHNCGVCVCTKCTENWPAVMMPVTFTMVKRRKQYRVCYACDWLSSAFRVALLSGDMDKIEQLYGTGNVNLRVPFAKAKGSYYPVHCAVLSGSLRTLKWLTEDQHCPIHSKNKGSSRDLDYSAVLTSDKRSVLGLAMENQEIAILYFLIIELGINIMEYNNLPAALRTVKLLLHHLPENLRVDAK